MWGRADLPCFADRPLNCSAGDCKAIYREGTFYAHLAVENDPDKASDRTKQDVELRPEMKRVWDDNLSVYGARKLWHAMKREKFDVARCTVERLMRDIGIEGVRRGKKIKATWPPFRQIRFANHLPGNGQSSAMPIGPCEQAVPRNHAQPTLGVGFY